MDPQVLAVQQIGHHFGEKGFFHCFGCGVGGNVFKFLELHEKVSFPEAVRMLAQKAGMSIPDTVDGNREDAGHDARTRETLLKHNDFDFPSLFAECRPGAARASADVEPEAKAKNATRRG